MSWNHDKLWGGHPAVTTGDDRTVGQRAADHMKALLATWVALIAVLLFIATWIESGGFGGDRTPFILLNLCLSCFAALQCFVLLISGKRGEQIAAEIARHTYENTCSDSKLLEENTALTRQVKDNTDLLDEVHRHVEAIGAKLGVKAGTSTAPPAQRPSRRKR